MKIWVHLLGREINLMGRPGAKANARNFSGTKKTNLFSHCPQEVHAFTWIIDFATGFKILFIHSFIYLFRWNWDICLEKIFFNALVHTTFFGFWLSSFDTVFGKTLSTNISIIS